MTPALLAALDAARAAARPIVLATRLPDGAQMLLPDADADAELAAAAARALLRDESATVRLSSGTWFLHAYNPRPRLVIVGAVHIAQTLAPMAARCSSSTSPSSTRAAPGPRRCALSRRESDQGMGRTRRFQEMRCTSTVSHRGRHA